jgi:hypothetical protein
VAATGAVVALLDAAGAVAEVAAGAGAAEVAAGAASAAKARFALEIRQRRMERFNNWGFMFYVFWEMGGIGF